MPSTPPDETQRQAQLLAGILAIAADAIISINDNHTITLFNNGAEQIFGYTSGEIMGQPLNVLLPERFRSRHGQHVRDFGKTAVAARQMGERQEIYGRRKSGEDFPAEASISKLMIGSLRTYTVVLRDVSSRKADEAARRQSEERLQLAVAAGQIGLFEHDHITGQIYWSSLFREIIGIGEHEPATPARYVATCHPGDRDRIAAGIAQALDPTGDGAYALEHRVMLSDGTIRWVAVTSRTHFAGDGVNQRPARTSGASRDVTERRLYLEELERRVADRTRALNEQIRQREQAQAALVQAQRMEALGQLTGGIAHDSNNLLTVILGNLEMIEDELQDHPALKYLLEAEEAAKMGARLNQRLLTFARRRKLEAKVINLNDHVLSMSELLRRTLGEEIDLTTTLAHDLWPARIDASELENAILNLAINARDAMPSGGSLRIETQNSVVGPDQSRDEPAPGDYVKLSVTDTGVGMPPGVLSRVFEPFFTTKEQGKGTGLGLSMLYGFVKQSAGHVSISSEVGRGTTVDVYVPREAGHEPTTLPRANKEDALRGGSETILIVEDNPQVRTLTIARLKRLGYRVLEAENGPRALAILEAGGSVDLIFSDVVMPGGMTGFDVARAVWQQSPGQRILLTSGFAEDAVPANDATFAARKILRKPYSMLELARAVREALDETSSP